MITRKLSWHLAACMAALTFTACGGDETQAPTQTHPLSEDIEVVGDHLAAMEQAIDTHAAHIAGLSDAAAVDAAETTHREEMKGHMDGVEGDLDGMHGCTNEDHHMPSTGAMHGMMDDMVLACDAHEQTMHGMDMDAAHAEELKHHAAMQELFASMHDEMKHMMDDDAMMGGHDCPGMPHGH